MKKIIYTIVIILGFFSLVFYLLELPLAYNLWLNGVSKSEVGILKTGIVETTLTILILIGGLAGLKKAWGKKLLLSILICYLLVNFFLFHWRPYWLDWSTIWFVITIFTAVFG